MSEWIRAALWGSLAALVVYRVTSSPSAPAETPTPLPGPFLPHQRAAEDASAAEGSDVETAALAAVLDAEEVERFRVLLLDCFHADAEWAEALGNPEDAEQIRRHMEGLAEVIADQSRNAGPDYRADILNAMGMKGIDRA